MCQVIEKLQVSVVKKLISFSDFSRDSLNGYIFLWELTHMVGRRVFLIGVVTGFVHMVNEKYFIINFGVELLGSRINKVYTTGRPLMVNRAYLIDGRIDSLQSGILYVKILRTKELFCNLEER